MTNIKEGIIYWIKLFILMSLIIGIGGGLLSWFVSGHGSWAIFTLLEFGVAILTTLYVMVNWNNPLGFEEVW